MKYFVFGGISLLLAIWLASWPAGGKTSSAEGFGELVASMKAIEILETGRDSESLVEVFSLVTKRLGAEVSTDSESRAFVKKDPAGGKDQFVLQLVQRVTAVLPKDQGSVTLEITGEESGRKVVLIGYSPDGIAKRIVAGVATNMKNIFASQKSSGLCKGPLLPSKDC